MWHILGLIHCHFNVTGWHSVIPWLHGLGLFIVVVGKDDCNNHTENYGGWYCYHQPNDEGIVETNHHTRHKEKDSYDDANHQGIVFGIAAWKKYYRSKGIIYTEAAARF